MKKSHLGELPTTIFGEITIINILDDDNVKFFFCGGKFPSKNPMVKLFPSFFQAGKVSEYPSSSISIQRSVGWLASWVQSVTSCERKTPGE